jgi:hypothetical protein
MDSTGFKRKLTTILSDDVSVIVVSWVTMISCVIGSNLALVRSCEGLEALTGKV